jgi:hypothetical protein
MNHERIREISTELCSIVEQQSGILLAGRVGSFTDMTTEEADGYFQRSDRLCELCKELNELV